MNDFRIQVIFCDDVRQEVGGKVTLVGVYRALLGLTTADHTMPKFVAFLQIGFDPSKVGSAARVQLLDRTNSIVDIPLTLPPRTATPVAQPEDEIVLNVPIELLGFQPKDGMILKVVFSCGDFRFESDALHIRHGPQPSARAQAAAAASGTPPVGAD